MLTRNGLLLGTRELRNACHELGHAMDSITRGSRRQSCGRRCEGTARRNVAPTIGGVLCDLSSSPGDRQRDGPASHKCGLASGVITEHTGKLCAAGGTRPYRWSLWRSATDGLDLSLSGVMKVRLRQQGSFDEVRGGTRWRPKGSIKTPLAVHIERQ